MMRVLSVVVLGVCLCVSLGSCVSLDPGTGQSTTVPSLSDADAVQSAAQTVQGIRGAQPGGIPKHFTQGDTGEYLPEEGDFDPNTYLSVLDHLSMEPGYVLDYLYVYDGMGGYPFIYARPSDQPPYTSSEEIHAALGDKPDYYSDRIQIDGTTEGFFQFAALRIMAGQFYLWWHANYNDAVIVPDKTSLDNVLGAADTAFEGDSIPRSLRGKAEKLDLTPTVTFPDEETAVVRLVTFSMWGGFEEVQTTIRRDFPHQVLDTSTETLIEYDCGVAF